jgi:hypothetical protein
MREFTGDNQIFPALKYAASAAAGTEWGLTVFFPFAPICKIPLILRYVCIDRDSITLVNFVKKGKFVE